MKKSSSQEQEYEALVPFERMALPEHYRRSYIAKRQEFFCNIQGAYGLWRYFQMLDWNLQNELDHIGRFGKSESTIPLEVLSKAHAKIRLAIELAFSRCTEEARSIMRDAIRLAVCAHRLRVDPKLQQIWRSKGDSVVADASFNRAFGKSKKTTLFKGPYYATSFAERPEIRGRCNPSDRLVRQMAFQISVQRSVNIGD